MHTHGCARRYPWNKSWSTVKFEICFSSKLIVCKYQHTRSACPVLCTALCGGKTSHQGDLNWCGACTVSVCFQHDDSGIITDHLLGCWNRYHNCWKICTVVNISILKIELLLLFFLHSLAIYVLYSTIFATWHKNKYTKWHTVSSFGPFFRCSTTRKHSKLGFKNSLFHTSLR